MPQPVIQVENLSKYYRLGLIGGGTLREDVSRLGAKILGKPDPLLKIGEEDHGNRKDGQIWALKDINLEVNEGEILGIIGRNGAGKSTLLKILSQITAPTEGTIKIRGRVGSLLEVGTGFHPELTGRENIYLNGTILGMSHAEVKSKLDEIIEFAEMAKFIDTPVKRYSSGMTVRLAFAVAAHLEPEILVIDEVLAVGDAAFQKKCLSKMKDVAGHGRTILFVSHNMRMIDSLCTRCLLLKDGGIIKTGKTRDIIYEYLNGGSNQETWWVNSNIYQNKKVNIKSVKILQDDIQSYGEIISDKNLEVRMMVKLNIRINGMVWFLRLEDVAGTIIFTSWNTDISAQEEVDQLGEFEISCFIDPSFLNAGEYFITVGSHIPKLEVLCFHEQIIKIRISSVGSKYNDDRKGLVRLNLEWKGVK